METKKTLTQIKLETLPNGYSLTINNEGFMYFNEIDLLAGFLSRVGMGETHQMDRGSIISSLFAAMMGDAYTNAVSTLRQRVSIMMNQLEDTTARMDQSIAYVASAQKTIEGLDARITMLKDVVKETADSQASVNSEVVAARNGIKELMKKADGVMKQLGDASFLINERKKKASAPSDDAKEPATPAPAQSAADADKKPRGRRKKNDEAVVAEIERQAAENPNIK